MLWLDQSWTPEPAPAGSFHFGLCNLGPRPVVPEALCYSSMTRIARPPLVDGGSLAERFGNHHRILPPEGLTLAPGEVWNITIRSLSHAPDNRTQGAMAAWVETPEGPIPVALADLAPPPGTERCPVAALEPGEVHLPLAVLPWPAQVAVTAWQPPRPLCPGQGLAPGALAQIAALHRRLFPRAPAIMAMGQGLTVSARTDAAIAPEGYRLDFTPEGVTLSHADEAGQRYGLIVLAQMVHGSFSDARFRLPAAGHIADAPRFGFRGVHVDVARNFLPLDDMFRVADIMAWHRFNRLHWHLTDDEGWRIEIPALPELTRIGAQRGQDAVMPPQYADGHHGQAGHYATDEAKALIAHAGALGIEIIPEIDMPGHMTAALRALPHLRDPDETPESYHSIQGYPNNALNPAVARVYEMVETVLDAICALFPSKIIHLGGDEVDAAAWAQSPAAQALAAEIGAGTGQQATMALQAHFLRRAKEMLSARGRICGGWDECAEGGGIDAHNTLLFAWRNVAKTAELMSQGYDVIATPGQAYYLDMVQDSVWDATGTSWAGPVPPRQSYDFEPADGLPEGAPGRLLGVQAGIWSEHLCNRVIWNDMVFPRLSAVAEAAWTPPQAKDWSRFAALSRLMPRL